MTTSEQKRSSGIEIDPKVPGREHYSLRYLQGGRIFSFAHQIDTVLSFEPRSVLEVGVGTGVVTAALRAAAIDVITVDVQQELLPDIVGSVTAIPARPGQFDVGLCSQVLEHLPFDQFGQALTELRRVVARGLVLSLPDITPFYMVAVKLPIIHRLQWTGTRRWSPSPESVRNRWNWAGHYWEIGYREIPLKLVSARIQQSGWKISVSWRVPEHPYHRFFRLTPA